MKIALKTAAAAVALLAGISTANASVHDTSASGVWGNFEGISTTGYPMCGMQTHWADGSIFMLKVQTNSWFFLQIAKPGWDIPEGQPVTVQLQIDNAPVLTLNGTGHNDGQMSAIHVSIGVNEPSPISQNKLLDDLTNLLRSGVSMHLYFSGTEAPWSASLRGASTTIMNFGRCILAMLPRDNGGTWSPPSPNVGPSPYVSTQPYRASQPF